MPKVIPSHVLLLLLFAFAFSYRLLLMLWAGYPPGADIGLHNSVIHSIVGVGNVDFLYNFYHIGGGVSLTFPGYHIFTSAVILMTGLPEYLAQAAVVSLFSAVIVLCAFLVTKKVWTASAALIVAFLAAISRFDVEMLMWAGYPNVLTLMLIPLTFYLYLEKDRFSSVPFYVSTSLLAASIFLTHSLSAVMFVGVLAPVVLLVLLWPKTMGASRKNILYRWILPLVFGAALVSPFLIQAVPTYLQEYGSAEITNATLASRILPYWIVLPLFLIVVGFFAFSVKYQKKIVTLPTLLFAMWVFVPLICTQGYLVGAPVDYNRFLYFLILPVLVFIAVLIDHGSETFAYAIDKNRGKINFERYKIRVNRRFEGIQRKLEGASKKLAVAATQKRLYSFFILFFLLLSFVALPIFATPSLNFGQTLQSYYQTMDNPKWEAMQWIKQNTSEGSVLVADALYGWWLGGFTQQPTLSAVEPAYLTVKREVDNATFARNLLDTDYIVDNGLIQVRDDGYLSRHNPEILVKQNWTYADYSFFTFSSQDFTVDYNVDGIHNTSSVKLVDLPTKETRLENYGDHLDIVVIQGNEFFNYTRTTTLYGGLEFVTVSSTLQAITPGVTFASVDMTIQTTGLQVQAPYDDEATIGIVETGTKDFGQLIFKTTPFYADIAYASKDSEVVKGVNLHYLFNGASEAKIDISAIAYSATNEQRYYDNVDERNTFFSQKMAENLNADLKPTMASFDVFDYKEELKNRSVSYVVLSVSQDSNPDKTELDIQAKFALDPLFSRVFNNQEVAIFQVNRHLQGTG
ncbi:MAG: hypothetical protein NWE93_07715 [Candidatus Bathyarchaeota archaeon]|nr:hypothetical protein [Candidatus Bathyarchaeota archaeon]